MLRHYRRNSERTPILFVKDARSIQIGSAFLTNQRPAKHDLSTSRDKMPRVVPHSCRFGAGYKSNERPTTGRLRATFLYEVNRARNYHANRAHTRGARVASRRLRPRNHRSEERRVGKECRSRWSP